MRRGSAALGRTASAIAVVLSTIGCAPPGPTRPVAEVEALRQSRAGLSALVAGDPRGTRVLLVHGTPGSAAAWADYLLAPPPGLEIVAVDRPGFGRSGPDGAVTGLAVQAEALAAWLPADGRRAVLLGHSLGGPIVARLAAGQPERIAAIVLLSASLDPALEKIHPLQPLGAWPPLRALLPRAIRNANAELMALRAELLALEALLPRIAMPVLIVHGTQDELVPFANVAFMRARLSGARCVVTRRLEGRDHFLPWNAEAEVRAAIAWAAEASC